MTKHVSRTFHCVKIVVIVMSDPIILVQTIDTAALVPYPKWWSAPAGTLALSIRCRIMGSDRDQWLTTKVSACCENLKMLRVAGCNVRSSSKRSRHSTDSSVKNECPRRDLMSSNPRLSLNVLFGQWELSGFPIEALGNDGCEGRRVLSSRQRISEYPDKWSPR